ncbi:hypothetical protein [uncultured Acinetobacter sp.]|uniref:hypothetical protein n=1 Tax=uncultured Acinetobacter sp. TaxID=165433 RepID=UPI00258BC7A2|nr:hypothetical protein [uncultured Acinetobacter sp.]
MKFSKDQITNVLCIFGLVFTICIAITISLKGIFHEKIDIAFIKDIFSIGTTIFAACAAVALYTDWKEIHNKTSEVNLVSKIIEELKDIINIYDKILESISIWSKSDKAQQYNFSIDVEEKRKYFEAYKSIEYLLYELHKISNDSKIEECRGRAFFLHQKLTEFFYDFDLIEKEISSYEPDRKLEAKLKYLREFKCKLYNGGNIEILEGLLFLQYFKLYYNGIYTYLANEKLTIK